jgi:polyisoprenoid-binding protein YceI
MSRLAKVLIAVGVAVVVLVGGAFAAWYFLWRSDPEPRAAIEKTSTTQGGTLDGTYTLTSGDPNSFVGYRVQEQFAAAVVESTATGRTSDVTGSFTITGSTVQEVDVLANLLTLTSDREMRDNRIKTLGLESERFPESRFVLVEPIELPKSPEVGETVTATAVGDFTLHGVTKRVDLEVEGRWDGRDVQVVGRLPIRFADYDMQAPNIGGFVSVRDEGEMELQLFFKKG